MEALEKPFGDCTLVYLEKNFGLRQVNQLDALDTWLNGATAQELTQAETLTLPIFQQLLTTNVTSWNEQDLSLHFIGPIFSLVNFTEPYRFNLFAERRISSVLTTEQGQNILLFGKPDEMIASGFRDPEAPFFCFQEFKRERDPNGDPLAQTLAAMLVGQAINNHQQPMYGCYVLGRDWYFLVLQEKSYCISRGYDATTEHLYDLFKILKAFKEIIKALTA
ncbi:MAG TPA: hypothetical protein DCR35_14340 [Runella sp.]|nr:hypothetical protein [Runella sp.]